ncbi:unnamed protein product [Lactuca virosa]|uniref:Uncharacterized protein n=1 Tax=Lactuca virosa TaxID=75947 RepID=A0AAU9N937_9ASTR|nr:unnamed protein product [Lactuca virosa]
MVVVLGPVVAISSEVASSVIDEAEQMGGRSSDCLSVGFTNRCGLLGSMDLISVPAEKTNITLVDLVSSDNQQQLTDEDVDTKDTVDSVKPLKTPRVTIQRQNRFSKLSHLPDDKDYRYGLELPVDVNHPIHGEDDAPHPTKDDVGVIQPNPADNDESESGED